MPASSRKQLNIRSDEARALAHALAAETGMTITQVIEAALRAYRTRRHIPSTRVTAEEADRNRLALFASLGLEEGSPALPAPRAPSALSARLSLPTRRPT